jgi:hypothetical protein
MEFSLGAHYQLYKLLGRRFLSFKAGFRPIFS